MTKPERKRRTRAAKSFTLDRDVIEYLEGENQRTKVSASEIANAILKEQIDKDRKKPTILAVMNHKGGVGKTMTSACLALCLGNNGHSVLIIDLDGQGNISQYMRVYDPAAMAISIADVMFTPPNGKPRLPLDDVIQDTDYKNVKIVPSSFRFSDSDSKMRAESSAVNLDQRLRYAIEDLQEEFEYIIIDCPPSLGITVTNAITALDAGNRNSLIIIPVKVDGFAIAGLSQTVDAINRIAYERHSSTSKPWMILKTVVEMNTNAYKEGLRTINDALPGAKFFETPIHKATVVPESTLMMTPLIAFDPKSIPAQDYIALTEEIEQMSALDMEAEN